LWILDFDFTPGDRLAKAVNIRTAFTTLEILNSKEIMGREWSSGKGYFTAP